MDTKKNLIPMALIASLFLATPVNAREAEAPQIRGKQLVIDATCRGVEINTVQVNGQLENGNYISWRVSPPRSSVVITPQRWISKGSIYAILLNTRNRRTFRVNQNYSIPNSVGLNYTIRLDQCN